MSRCVRKEPLLADPTRRAWLVARAEFLSNHMGIDTLTYAIMENHMHLVLRTRPELVRGWTDKEVATRRVALLPNKRKRRGMGMSDDATKAELEIASILSSPLLIVNARRDLSSLGFYHRLLKEPSARMWNREDGVKGHFWEARYKSPKVLDHQALLDVSTYVELNQVHACTASSVQTSFFTSARLQWQRLCEVLLDACVAESRGGLPACQALSELQWQPVFPCRESIAEAAQVKPLPATGSVERLSLLEYVDRLDRVGRRARPDKPGLIHHRCSRAVNQAIAKAAKSLLFGDPLAKQAVDSLAQWWRTIAAVEAQQSSTCRDAIAAFPLIERNRGSCYGSLRSVAIEVARRDCAWLVPICSSG